MTLSTTCKLICRIIQKRCGSSCSERMAAPVPVRLARVAGYQGRSNDIVYTPPWSPSPPDSNAVQQSSSQVVVFFGGDVQDFSENMEAHRDNKRYAKWNLENTASILQSQFENHHIVVVRPSRMEFKMFSCFDNFVPCNNTGAPDHTPMHFALLHLERLLQNISVRLNERKQQVGAAEQQNSSTNKATTGSGTATVGNSNADSNEQVVCRLDKCDSLTLIGFSKGCVVLNQFVYEFHYLKTLTPDDQSLSEVVSRISDMYWLDGGHSGGKNTWVTSRSLLETLTRLGIRVHVHVTPFQINDDRRPWIRKEERSFTEWLKRLGAPLSRHVHFDSLPPNLATHLELITAFKQSTPTTTAISSPTTDEEVSDSAPQS
ncbi:mitochondrial protein C2orf69 homolog isoform X2 [Rhodnius prolixus]|uniref:mitochondrial protein C2orf69 homolog isoform X2 n=1 Tax=Rhodnius prolixus TaxID=13249 RepID=UPI003D18CD78